MKYLTKVSLISSKGLLLTLDMKKMPRSGEKIIVENKRYVVTNVTWILEKDTYCYINILEI